MGGMCPPAACGPWRFDSLQKARVIVEGCRCDYDAKRPHFVHHELTPLSPDIGSRMTFTLVGMGDTEPMEELMSLLRPEEVLAKIITGGGQWGVQKPRYGDPAFCLVLDGPCLLEPEGLDDIELRRGDFLLFPQTPEFTMRSRSDTAPIFTALDHPAPRDRCGPAIRPPGGCADPSGVACVRC